ncbi:MAG TPA: thiol reductant ABC exporter subunit CydD [Motilibacteraceae bacterium]|nr:thiol reductant ABC exporter subunit CydD [Motilibacteraceae bacterium]
MKPLDPRLVRHARATVPFLAGSVALGVLTAGCVLVQAGVLAHAVSAAFLDGASIASLRGDVLLLLGVVLVRALTGWGQEALAARSSSTVKSQLRSAVLRRAMALGPAWMSGQRSGRLVQLATRGVDALDPYFARYLPQLVLTAVVTPLVLARIALADWISGVIVLITLPLVPVFMALVGWRTQTVQQRQWSSLQRLSAHFLDVVDGLPTLKVFGRAKAQERSIEQVTGDYRRATMKVLRVSFLSAFVLELAATLSVALVAVDVGLRLLDGRVALETALLVLVLAPEAYLPLRQVGASYHAAAEGVAAAEEVLAVLDEPLPPAADSVLPFVGVTGLEVQGVSVSYDRSEHALPPTSLVLRPGEVTALVGPSGAGKSTLLAVLLGFARPTTGRVLVGGVDLADADLAAWRRQVAWVPQRVGLLAGTVADNVRLGHPDAGLAEVRRALSLAAAADLDPALPLAEDGAGLSTGQRQRIALARAFLHAERVAGLLLLDEPTSALDGASEAHVVASLRELSRDRCVLVVVHRPALAAAADRVVRVGEPLPLPAPARGAA